MNELEYTIVNIFKNEILEISDNSNNKDNKNNDIINLKKNKYIDFFKKEHIKDELFIGIPVKIIRKYIPVYIFKLKFKDLEILLNSKYHEIKLFATLLLVEKYNKFDKYSKNDKINKELIFNFYLKNLEKFNNWDLVDSSSYKILGNYLLNYYNYNSSKKILFKLLKSDNFWIRRIALVSMLEFIKQRKFKLPIEVINFLLNDNEDLIKKPLGWMLREIGKKDKKFLIDYLVKNINSISAISLRYSIEKFNKNEKEYILKIRNKNKNKNRI